MSTKTGTHVMKLIVVAAVVVIVVADGIIVCLFCVHVLRRKMANFKKFASSIISLSQIRRCAILEMKNGENRFNSEFIGSLNNALDAVEEAKDVDALVTIGSGKFFSNGLDLAFVLDSARDDMSDFMKAYSKLMARFLTFPMPTVAAINGHAFAGGGILAMVHDYRLMREDRGWICLNEVRLRLRFPPGICDLLSTKISQKQTLMEFLVYGKRFTGPEALKLQLIDGICKVDDLPSTAVSLTENLVGKETFDKASVRTMKMDLYKSAAQQLTREFTFEDLQLYSASSKV